MLDKVMSNKSLLGFGMMWRLPAFGKMCRTLALFTHWLWLLNLWWAAHPLAFHNEARFRELAGPRPLAYVTKHTSAEVTGAGGLFDSHAILRASREAALRNATHSLVNTPASILSQAARPRLLQHP